MPNRPDDMGAYWDKAVLEWEQTAYDEAARHQESPGLIRAARRPPARAHRRATEVVPAARSTET